MGIATTSDRSGRFILRGAPAGAVILEARGGVTIAAPPTTLALALPLTDASTTSC